MNRNKRAERLKLALFLFFVVMAFASAALAVRPLVFRAEKTQEIKRETKRFYTTAMKIQEQTEPEKEVPYEQLLHDLQTYNQWLYDVKQGNLTGPDSYEESLFKLADYGLEDEVFGVISIPKMELEMPVYLGATYENMAAGAAVLTQTSAPIGGEDTNAVIAGHRGWNGYDYFRYIDKLEVGDKVEITNLWETLTYSVKEIKIISPNDVNAILIQPGRDLITLLTCHPYASGGRQRYLVFCERDPPPVPVG